MKTRVMPWLLTLALLCGAWAVVKLTPPDDADQAPFVTTAEIGELAVARNLAVTVTDVHAARRVTDAGGWSADGTWLVVDLEAAAQVSQEAANLAIAELSIGGRTFTATDRGTTFVMHPLVTGVPRSGSLAFELPDDALTGNALLRIAVTSGALGGVPLDGMIELPIDLDELPVEAEVELLENGWAR